MTKKSLGFKKNQAEQSRGAATKLKTMEDRLRENDDLYRQFRDHFNFHFSLENSRTIFRRFSSFLVFIIGKIAQESRDAEHKFTLGHLALKKVKVFVWGLRV